LSDGGVPIDQFRLDLDQLTYTGHDLVRPESVLAQSDGTLWSSDARGGVTRIDPNGEQRYLGGLGGQPNGLAMARDGAMLVANHGTGTVQKLHTDGRVEEVLGEVDGVALTALNFVFRDRKDRLWITCSTREPHWWPAVASPRPDGFVVLLDERGPRVVAEGIYFTNEARLDAAERYLYVAETMQNRLLRFPVLAAGGLGEPEVFGPSRLGHDGAIDGFAFDADGNVWLTDVLRNGVGIITADGDYHVVLEDPRPGVLSALAAKAAAGDLQPDDLMAAAGATLQLITSVAFGGPDRRTVYLGSLGMSRLPSFRSPIPGLPLAHWR
jgi:sugar lactone lactonase YvrE